MKRSVKTDNFSGINYIKIDVIQGKIHFVEAIFDVNYAKINFIGLTPGHGMTWREKYNCCMFINDAGCL